MQEQKFTESYNDLCQCMAKPMLDFAKLNLDTFNRVTRSSDYLSNFSQAKEPQELMAAQIKLINAASLEALKYFQTASAILLEAANQGGKMFNQVAKDTLKTESTEKSNIRKPDANKHQ